MRARRYSLCVLRFLISMAIVLAIAIAGCTETRSPTLTVLPTQHVTISRLISKDYPPRAPNCAVITLAEMPSQGYQNLGTIQMRGVARSQEELIELIDQVACSMGADAVFISQDAHESNGPIQYRVIAQALASGHTGSELTRREESAEPGTQGPQSRTVEIVPGPTIHGAHAQTIEVAPTAAATPVAPPAATVVASPEPAATSSSAATSIPTPSAAGTLTSGVTPAPTSTTTPVASAKPAQESPP